MPIKDLNNEVLIGQLKAHFNLREDPFSSSNKCFYEGAQRKHNLETLRHLAIFGDMVLLLTGEPGAGKTSLVERFVQIQVDELRILLQSKPPKLSRKIASLDKAVSKRSVNRFASLVGLQSVDGEASHQTLARLIQKLEFDFQETGKRSLMVIDDADLLPEEELQLYFTVFRDLPVESGVVLLLVGTPRLLDVAYENEGGNAEWLHQIQLKPFSNAETIEYVECRLVAAGCAENLCLSEGQLENLVKISKGLPNRVNRFFAYVLFELGLPEAEKTSVNHVARKVLIVIVGLLFLSFLLVSYQHGLFNFSDQTEEVLVVEVKSAEQIMKDAQVLLERQQAARLKMLDQAIEASATKAEIIALVADNSASVLIVEQKQVEVLIENKNTIAQELSSGASSSNSEKNKTIIQLPILHAQFKERDWVVVQAKTNYSAQLLGSYSEKTAIQFIDEAKDLQSELYYLKTQYKGRDWYVVFYGNFQSKKIARMAMKTAPKLVQKQGPWLRRFDGILKSYPK